MTLTVAAIQLVCAVAIIATPINGYFFLPDGSILSSPAFVPNSCIERRMHKRKKRVRFATSSDDDSDDNDDANNRSKDESSAKNDELLSQSESATLSWRLDKVRLEEANKPHWLKSKPLKLSYAQSQKWIRRNWAIATREEFEDLVENGNLRTPYISKRPEEYYGERGEWISWDHYLLGDCTDGDVGGSGTAGNTGVLKWQ